MNTETHFFRLAEDPASPFRLAGGGTLSAAELAYETYGTLSADRDNAVLIFHALSGSQHAAGYTPSVRGAEDLWNEECQYGWWDGFVGPGKAVDTDRWFVVCANYIGGCYGSTGPRSIEPETGRPYGGRFPRIEISDIVDSQLRLLDHLGIRQLHAVVGGSLGGLLCLDLAVRRPERVRRVVPIASGLRTTILQRIHNFEQIYAIEEDANYNNGFYERDNPPNKGLALARMISQKTFVSLHTIENRSRGEIVQHEEDFKHYELTNQVESYMLHQGKKFVKRFDANTYLRILEAWQYFDLPRAAGEPDINACLARCRNQEYLIFSVDSDVCFYPEDQEEMAQVLRDQGVPCSLHRVRSEKGHDSFLVEEERYADALRNFLAD